MPPIKVDSSADLVATDVETSDAPTDDSWISVKNGGDGSTPRKKFTPHQGNNTPAMISSLSTPSRSARKKESSGTTRHSNSRSGTVKRAQTLPVTPSKTHTPSSSGRLEAIQKALSSLNLDSNTPSLPATPSRVQNSAHNSKQRVVVVSSDEEETDIEVSYPPTRASSFQRDNPSKTSSAQSSQNSLFATVSPTSSASSIEWPSTSAKFSSPSFSGKGTRSVQRPTTPPRSVNESPTVVQDVFNADILSTSHNVTRRKTPKREVGPPKGRSSQPPPTPSQPTSAPIPSSVLEFARSPFGTDLETMVIAHCDVTQKLLDDNRIAWGTQYELARGISCGFWTWEEARIHIHQLKGDNVASAFKVDRLMKSQDTSQPSDFHVWKQLDLEQLAMKENLGRGLGLMGDFQGETNWSGGKIQQICLLVKEGQFFKIKLTRMESRRSHRFARYYGSRRFLQLRVSEDLLKQEREKIKKFLRRKFVVCGRVFVPFHSKEKKIYLVETNDDYGRSGQPWCADETRCSFNEFINWHNPLDVSKNVKQVISKYAARFALGLSNSIPAVEFDEEDIHFIDDITAEDWPKDKKGAPADKLMTDGCGFINLQALRLIVKTLGYSSNPAGIQGRIDGSKGFFILHPTDTSLVPKIWIRDSQHKIKNRSFDRAHRILDLLCASQPSSSNVLSSQIIVNLFANGIPAEMLVQLMEQGLEDDVAPLLDWDRPNAMLFLQDAVSKAGAIPGTRVQRVSYALNRVLGFARRDLHDDDGIVPEADKDEASEVYTGRNKYSGAPLGLQEIALELLQAGFHPMENTLLRDKLEYIIKTVINSSVEKYRIPIAESLQAFIVPDPVGILEEGEVCYRFSKPRADPETGLLCYGLEGNILLGRYPIRLPSDVQRVKAVDKRELDKWPDVLIVSTKGKRSIASLLADGDMDGDEIIAIYNKSLVQLFLNKEFTKAPPDFIANNFKRDVESVEQFCNRVSNSTTREAHEAFQEVLISNLSETQVGQYSSLHENACIKYGYDSGEAIRLAYIFATLLDSSKNGCRLKQGIFDNDRSRYGFLSMQSAHLHAASDILAILKEAGMRKGGELLDKYKKLGQCDEGPVDKSLTDPYQRTNNDALKSSELGDKTLYTELQLIRDQVTEASELYSKAFIGYTPKQEQESPVKKSKRPKKEKKEDMHLESARKFAETIQGLKLIRNVDEVKASFAYQLRPKFAFAVAFRRLCLIKAEALGGTVPILRAFDEAKIFSPAYLRALESSVNA